jgi:hypothetical protein
MRERERERERESCAIYLWIEWSLDSSITTRQSNNIFYHNMAVMWRKLQQEIDYNFCRQIWRESWEKNHHKFVASHIQGSCAINLFLASSQIHQKLVIQFDNPTEHGGLREIPKYTERIITLYIKFSSDMPANKFSKLQCYIDSMECYMKSSFAKLHCMIDMTPI